MELFHRIKSYLLKWFSPLQLLSLLIVFILAFFVSDTSLFSSFSYDSEIRNLKDQVEFYREKSAVDQEKLDQLKSDKSNVERFARENYLMKKENEEIFVIE